MTTEERRTQVSQAITNSHFSPLERLENIELIYAEAQQTPGGYHLREIVEAALLCMHAAAIALDHDDEEGHDSALADAAEVLAYGIDNAAIGLSDRHQQIIRDANKYALEHRDD